MTLQNTSKEILDIIVKFFNKFPLVQFSDGDILFRQDESPKGVYYLKEGYVKQYSTSNDGQDVLLHIFSPGAYFPMTWALSDIPNSYSYKAVNKVTCNIAKKKDFVIFIKSNPEVLLELTQRLLFGISGLLDRTLLSSFASGYKRVISTLLYLAKHFGERNMSKVTIATSFTHAELASFAGLARETTTNELKKLKQKKLISVNKRVLIIPNINELVKEFNK